MASAYQEELARIQGQARRELNLPTRAAGMAIDPSWIAAGSQVLSAALAPAPAGPSRAESGGYNSLGFDNSGFVVNTGSGSAAASTGISVAWLALLAGAGILAWAIVRK